MCGGVCRRDRKGRENQRSNSRRQGAKTGQQSELRQQSGNSSM
jgi:hypothetical protein